MLFDSENGEKENMDVQTLTDCVIELEKTIFILKGIYLARCSLPIWKQRSSKIFTVLELSETVFLSVMKSPRVNTDVYKKLAKLANKKHVGEIK